MDQILAGRYELEIPLGRGGSGEVWRGRDLATRRPVAVKVVELSQTDDPGMLSETIGRFRREATVIGSLKHQNIVSSLDAGRVGSQLFMVMELAPGISLASMMDERGERGMGLFPVSSVLRIAEETCAGLEAAHQASIVHRDIKPSNLMVTPSLGVKIIDFGIARLLAENSPRLTLQGHTVGTAAYMSPEQAQGGDIDGRADLYSLGCVLYHLLSGRLPFRSSMPGALLMMQVMDSATPLNVFRPDLPDEIIGLVSDLMEKDRAARPADAAEVIGRLRAIGETLGSEEPAHEADRQTVMADDALGVGETRQEAGETRQEAGEAWRQAAAPETGRPGVIPRNGSRNSGARKRSPRRRPGPLRALPSSRLSRRTRRRLRSRSGRRRPRSGPIPAGYPAPVAYPTGLCHRCRPSGAGRAVAGRDCSAP